MDCEDGKVGRVWGPLCDWGAVCPACTAALEQHPAGHDASSLATPRPLGQVCLRESQQVARVSGVSKTQGSCSCTDKILGPLLGSGLIWL